MKNRGFVVFLTIIVTLLCLYYLSFTFVSNSVQQDAITYASDENGNVDFALKQAFLDSVWNEPVYNLLGMEYTYKEIKETELSLGLDLQGGMHVTMEVSPVDIIKGLSGNNDDEQFLEALQMAGQKQKESQTDFVTLFVESYKEISDGADLAPIFANAANRDKGLSFQSSDTEVIRIINEEVDMAIERSFNILRTRVDRFGTSQPNIQQIPGTGRIQIELPGVENRERVRKLLQGVAKLEFWEVVDFYDQELGSALSAVNARLAEEERRLETIKEEIEARIEELSIVQKQVEEKLARIEKIETEEERLRREAEERRIRQLLKIYASMKPKEFVPIMAKLDFDDTMKIIKRMKSDQIGKILLNVDKDLAVKISNEIIAEENRKNSTSP